VFIEFGELKLNKKNGVITSAIRHYCLNYFFCIAKIIDRFSEISQNYHFITQMREAIRFYLYFDAAHLNKQSQVFDYAMVTNLHMDQALIQYP